MSERISVLQSAQVGIETTPGAAAAATHRLGSLSIEPQPKIKTGEFTPQGAKAVTVTTLVENYSESKMSGVPTYTELQYALATVIGNADVDAVAEDSKNVAHTWAFQPNTYGADTVSTLTVETGDSTRAQRVTGAVGSELSLTWSAGNDPKVDATLIGSAIADGVSLTEGPLTSAPLVPINLTEATLFLDSSAGAFGSTKLTRAFEFEVKTSGRRKPFFTLDAANAGSPAGVVETSPSNEVSLLLEADDKGMAFYNQLAATPTWYLRAAFSGAAIPGSDADYGLVIDLACQVKNVDSLSDHDGVWAVKVSLTIVDDGAGNNQRYVLTNGAAAL